MGGRVTYLHGRHSSTAGRWIAPIADDDFMWPRLEAAIHRPLLDHERVSIGECLSYWRDAAQDYRRNGVSREDSIATLAALSRLDSAAAARALKHMDGWTKALLALDLHHGATPQIAAQNALQQAKAKRSIGGRPSKGFYLDVARYALASWVAAGGSDMRISFMQDAPFRSAGDPYRPAPLAEWTQAMLDCVDGKLAPSATCKQASTELAAVKGRPKRNRTRLRPGARAIRVR